MNVYKLDIFTSSPFSENTTVYNESIIFNSEKDASWIVDYISTHVKDHFEVTSYYFEEYILLHFVDFLRHSSYIKEIIKTCDELNVTTLDDIRVRVPDWDYSEFVFISGESIENVSQHYDLSFLNNYRTQIIKSTFNYEKGCSAFWENYIIGIASSLTITLIDKLLEIGFPKENISIWKIPSNILHHISSTYHINPKTLFLERFSIQNDYEEIVLRSPLLRCTVRIQDNIILDISTDYLNINIPTNLCLDLNFVLENYIKVVEAEIINSEFKNNDIRFTFLEYYTQILVNFYNDHQRFQLVDHILKSSTNLVESEHLTLLRENHEQYQARNQYLLSLSRNLFTSTFTAFEYSVSIIFDNLISDEHREKIIINTNKTILKKIAGLDVPTEVSDKFKQFVIDSTKMIPLKRKIEYLLKSNKFKNDRKFVDFISNFRNCVLHSNGFYSGETFTYNIKGIMYTFEDGKPYTLDQLPYTFMLDLVEEMKSVFKKISKETDSSNIILDRDNEEQFPIYPQY